MEYRFPKESHMLWTNLEVYAFYVKKGSFEFQSLSKPNISSLKTSSTIVFLKPSHVKHMKKKKRVRIVKSFSMTLHAIERNQIEIVMCQLNHQLNFIKSN